MTIPLDAETVALEWSPAEVDVATGTGTAGKVWTAKVVDRYGTELAALDQVKLGTISRRINQEATAGFVLPRALVATYDAIDLVAAELQVYRGESLRFFGPIYTDQGTATDKGSVPFGAAGFWSLFRRRLRGGWQPWSRNYIANFRFDDDLDRWVPTGTVSIDGAYETGAQSALIEGAISSISQTFLIDVAVKFQLVVAARVRVGASASPGRGLEVSVPGVQGGDGFRAAQVTASTPRGSWTTLTAVLNIEGRVGARSVTVSVFGCDGDDVNVDRVEATVYPITALSESQPTADPETADMGTVVSELIQATNGGLNVGVDSPTTGVLVPNTPDEWTDKTADEIMRIFTGREDGLEFSEVWTPTSRTIRTHYPRQGVDWDPEVLTLSCPGNLTKLERTRNGTDAVTEVTMIGDGGYRGVARDETAFGGLLLQKVERAPTGVPLADLEGRARKSLKASIDAVTALKGWMTMADFVASGLDMGDRVQVECDSLALQVDQVCRVVQIDEDPSADLAMLLLNPEPVVGS